MRVLRSLVLLLALGAAGMDLLFAAFGLHVRSGGAYEMRTVGAMTLRSLVWLAVAAITLRMQRRSAPVCV